MKNYIIGADGINREIPGIYGESFANEIMQPSRTSDGSFAYNINSGSTQVANFVTRPLEDSNASFNKLYGYLKGRGWVSERVVLERNGGEIQAYVHITETETNFAGRIKNKRSMNITIFQKY